MAKIKQVGKWWYGDGTRAGKRYRPRLSMYREKAQKMFDELMEIHTAEKNGISPKNVSWYYLREEVIRWYKENRNATTHYKIKHSIEMVELHGGVLEHSTQMNPKYMEEFLVKWKKAKLRLETGLEALRWVKTAIKWAEARQLTPTQNWTRIKMTPYAARVEYFGYKELDKVFDVCGPMEDPYTGHWKTAAILMAYAGLRSGEVRHLEWKDIDFKERVIRIHAKTVQDIDGQMVYWEPKESEPNKPRNRVVDMGDRLEAYLQSLPSRQGFVLGGDLVRMNTYRRYFGRLTKRVKFRVFAHKFRHTYASFVLSSGVSLERLQVLMGHADIRSTAIYSHLMPHARRTAVDQMNASLPPSPHFGALAPQLEVLQANG